MLERWNSRGPAALNGVMHLPEGAYSQTRRIRREPPVGPMHPSMHE